MVNLLRKLRYKLLKYRKSLHILLLHSEFPRIPFSHLFECFFVKIVYRNLDLEWQLRPSISCTIKESGIPCEDYLGSIPANTNEGCDVEVEFKFAVENTGEVCEEIESVIATINGNESVTYK